MKRSEDKVSNKCQKHEDSEVEALYFCKENVSCGLKCIECITEDLLQPQNIILLKKLTSNDPNFIFPNWPPMNSGLNQRLINQLKTFQTIDYDQQIQQLTQFFQDLREQVLSSIKKKESEIFEQITQNKECQYKYLSKYNEISSKEELKEIINNTSNDIDKKNELLKIIISNKFDKLQENSIELEDMLEEKKNQHCFINEKYFNDFTQKIISDINSLNFFYVKQQTQLPFQISSYSSSGGGGLFGGGGGPFGDGKLAHYFINITLEPQTKYQIVLDVENISSQNQFSRGGGLFSGINDKFEIGFSKNNYFTSYYNFSAQSSNKCQTIKGQKINSALIKQKSSFLIQICLKDQIFEIIDFPNKANITRLSNELIDSNLQNAKFGFIQTQDYSLQIQSITTVNIFD